MSTKFMRAASAAAAITLFAIGAAGCSSDSAAEGDAAASSGGTVKIGFMGDLTGPNKALGINIRNGAKLAIDQYNATSPATTIELVEYDSQGDPKQATALAPKVIEDGIVGLVGPAFSGETADTGAIWQEAGIPFVSASATRVALADNGWTTFHRVLADDGFQGPGVANFVVKGLTAPRSPSSTTRPSTARASPTRLATAVKVRRRHRRGARVRRRRGHERPELLLGRSAPSREANVDAVVLRRLLRPGRPVRQAAQGRRGHRGLRRPVTARSTRPSSRVPGAAADGRFLSCTCALINDAATGAAATFYTDYKAAFNVDPGTYSPEGYDAATIFINGVKDGKTTSADLLPYVSAVNFAGVSKQIQFESNGNIKGGTVLMYKVVDGKITSIGTTDDATA